MGTLLRRDVAGFAGNVIKGADNRIAKLDEWLEIATAGIVATGKERISREIEAHYAEAVRGHVADGESEEMAQTKALADLGKPSLASRRFRKEYLTDAVLSYVKRLRESTLRPAAMAVLGMYVSFGTAWLHANLEKRLFLTYLYVNLLVILNLLYLPKSPRVNQMPTRLLLIECIRFTWMGLLLFLMLPNSWLRVGVSIPFFWLAIRNLQLRQKFLPVLRKT